MKMLTRIERLDQSYPGLADQVRVWFDRGVHVRKVVELLREHHHLCVARSTVGNFRARRWACEREARHNEAARRQAALEVTRELEMKDSPEAPTASLQAKVRSLFCADICGCLQRALAKSARIKGCPSDSTMKRTDEITGVC